MKRPLCIGLTGGIGSGKSLAATFFRDLGADIIDTDEISHRLTGPKGGAIEAIRRAFGDAVIASDGRLDRAAMRRIVFADPGQRSRLEAILHPMIRAEVRQQLQAAEASYAIVAIPLLLETGGAYDAWLDRVLVVDCDETLQVSRAAGRPGMDVESVRRVMANQVARATRREAADDLLENNGSPADLRAQVETLHHFYLQLAEQGPSHDIARKAANPAQSRTVSPPAGKP